MKKRKGFQVAGRFLVFMFVCASMAYSQDVSVTINENVTYQTIEGLGGQHINGWKIQNGPFFIDANLDQVHLYDSLYSSLGITLLRHFMSEQYEPSPGVFIIGSELRQELTHFRKMMQVAKVNNDTLRIIGSVLCAPAFMKYSRVAVGGGTLDTNFYDEYAEYLIKYIKMMKDSFSIDLYALSPQNEPFFDEPYAQVNYYNSPNYKTMYMRVMPQVRAAYPKLKFFFPEHMGTLDGILGWTRQTWDLMLHDSESSKYADIGAVHSYLDGIAPSTGTADGWTAMYNNLNEHKKPLWMTETSGFERNGDPALKYAQDLGVALRYGHIAAWSYLDITGALNFIDKTTITPMGYAAKHYYKFIRPGMVQVQSTYTDKDLVLSAYENKTTKVMTVVMYNMSSTLQKTISLSINGTNVPATFNGWKTTKSEKFKSLGSVGKTGIVLPPNGLITLYTGSAVAVQNPQERINTSTMQKKAETYEVYDMKGRAVNTNKFTKRNGVSGIYLVKTSNGISQSKAFAQMKTKD